MLRLEPPAASFADVAEQLSQPLLRYLRTCIGDAAAADDLLQDTLLRIARSLPGFRGEASVKTWAFTIATHVAVDYLRRPERRIRTVEVDEAIELPGGDDDAGERLLREEMSDCVRQMLAALPWDYRAALILHDLEGLTMAETARAAGCSLPTARMRIHRGRTRLRQILQQGCAFHRDAHATLRCDRKTALPGSPAAAPGTN